MPQFAYGRQPALLLGQVADYTPRSVDSFKNAMVAQIDQWAFVGFAAGVYTWTIIGQEGTFVVSVTNPANLAAVIAAFDAETDLLNIVKASDNGGALRLTFLHEGYAYVTSATSTGSALTKTAVQSPIGPVVGLGLVVAQGANDDEAVSAAGKTVADFVGVTVRNEEIEFNEGNRGGFDGVDEFVAGAVLSVMRQGRCVVFVEDAVSANAQCFVRVTAGAGETAGAFRSDGDGGDALSYTGARFYTSTTGPGLAVITLNNP